MHTTQTKTTATAIRELVSRSGVTTPTTTSNFDFAFQTFGEPELTNALNQARKFAAEVEANGEPRWLTLTGKSGTGKTYLAKKLQAHWRKSEQHRKYSAKPGGLIYTNDFVTWSEFAEKLRDGKYHLVRELSEVEFAVIDEMGLDHDPNNFALSKLVQILNARLGKWTVITSNSTRGEIAKAMDVRIASRIGRARNVIVDLANTKDFYLREDTKGA